MIDDDYVFADAYLEMFNQDNRFLVEHSGVKGMSWHKHKFGKWQSQAVYAEGQSDPDAKKKSRSDTGKSSGSGKGRGSSKKTSKAKSRNSSKKSKVSKRKQEILRDPKKLYKHRKEFTDAEIKKALQTIDLDKRLRDYSDSQTASGMKKVKNAVDITKTSIDGYNQLARIYNTVASVFDLETNLPYVENPNGGKKKKNNNNDDDDD